MRASVVKGLLATAVPTNCVLADETINCAASKVDPALLHQKEVSHPILYRLPTIEYDHMAGKGPRSRIDRA